MELQTERFQSGNHDGFWTTKKTKKPYVRVMTDKRREQNRRAQKVYRDKVKRKLETLEEQVASNVPIGGLQVLNDTEDRPEPLPTQGNPLSDVPNSNLVNFEDIFASAGDLSLPKGIVPSTFQYPTTPSPPPAVSQIVLSNKDDSQLLNNETTSQLWPWPTPYRQTNAVYSPPHDATGSYMSGSLTVVSPSYAYKHQKRRLLNHNKQTRFQDFSLPSPQLTTLTLRYESNLSASLAIGVHLGITHTAYLEDHPSQFPGCFRQIWFSEHTSFWTASCEADFRAGRFADVPDEVDRHMARIKEPLRPRPVQMLDAHPSYLDCIVFPKLRERACQASAEGRLDHVEFFLDLMHGGLVCWGSAVPKRGGRGRKRGMADQVAWSARSWEARRWFLDKWWWLVGTEEEEEAEGDRDGVWQCSRWWWSLRGEVESDDDEDEDEQGEKAEREGWIQGQDGSRAFNTDGISYNW